MVVGSDTAWRGFPHELFCQLCGIHNTVTAAIYGNPYCLTLRLDTPTSRHKSFLDTHPHTPHLLQVIRNFALYLKMCTKWPIHVIKSLQWIFCVCSLPVIAHISKWTKKKSTNFLTHLHIYHTHILSYHFRFACYRSCRTSGGHSFRVVVCRVWYRNFCWGVGLS